MTAIKADSIAVTPIGNSGTTTIPRAIPFLVISMARPSCDKPSAYTLLSSTTMKVMGAKMSEKVIRTLKSQDLPPIFDLNALAENLFTRGESGADKFIVVDIAFG